jgi:hypothetical protein
VTQITRRTPFFSVIYGSCEAGDDQGCSPPLVVQTVHMCRATVRVAPLRAVRQRRGVRSGLRGGGVVLMTGRQEVRPIGRPALVRQAVAQLSGLNHLLAPGDDPPPTLPGSAARMPCIPGRR